jgi:hypothetical protein
VGHWGVPGGGPGQLNVPLGIAADCNGNIYIANSRNNHVDEFDKNGNAIRAFGIGKLAVPTGIAFDEDSGGGGCGISTIYVSDEYNNDVVVFDGSYQYMKTIGGPGTGPMQFGGPEEIAFDDQLGGNQTLWVSESGNNRVQELTTENGGATWTSAAMVTHGDEGSIVQPHGTTLTPTGDLLIDDSAGHLFEYADKAAALTLKAYHMSRQHLRTSSQLSYVLDYNQVDGSCLVTVTAKLVARNYAFTLTKKVKGLTDTGDLVDLRLTQRQLTHVEDGWKNGGPDLRIHTVADGSCTGGKQLTATSSSKF